MDLLFNDLSIHQQFYDIDEFRNALVRLLNMREVVSQFGMALYCHRNITSAHVNPSMSVYEALQAFTHSQKRSLLAWFNRHGPFWEDIPEHGPDHWLEYDNAIVTDTALGEAAYCSTLGIDRRLVSLTPSNWEHTPLLVTMLNNETMMLRVHNYWTVSELEIALREAEPPIASWQQLERLAISRFTHVRFSADAFHPLRGMPFSPTAAEYVQSRLHTLNAVMESRDEFGNFASAARPILKAHLAHGSAHFSDSSEREKVRFRNELSFPHPDRPWRIPGLYLAR